MAGNLDLDELKEQVAAGAIDTVLACFPDMQGRLIGKRVSGRFFVEQAADEMHACDYLLAVDMEMEPVPGYAAASWDLGYGDFAIRPDLATLRRIPWLDGTALVLGDVVDHHGELLAHAPRSILRRQIARAEAMGYGAKMATELEFYVFDEPYRSARAEGLQRPRDRRLVHRGLPHPADDQGGGPDPRDPQRHGGCGHPGRVVQGRMGSGPGGAQSALRGCARDGRPPRHLQERRQGDRAVCRASA